MLKKFPRIRAVFWLLVGCVLAVALYSYHPLDQSWNTASNEVQNLLGIWGAWSADILLQIFGSMAFMIPLGCILFALLFFMGVRWIRLRICLYFLAILGGDYLLFSDATFPLFKAGLGGFVGQYMNRWWEIPRGNWMILWWAIVVGLFIFSMKLPVVTMMRVTGKVMAWICRHLHFHLPQKVVDFFKRLSLHKKVEKIKKVVPKVRRKGVEHKVSVPVKKDSKYELPSSELLQPIPVDKVPVISDEAMRSLADSLEHVLQEFRVPGKVVKYSPGPVVTLFSFEPASGVTVSRIISLADSVAMNMGALAMRMAVVPGTNTIGIEVPNRVRQSVSIREMIEAKTFWDFSGRLPIILGKNIGGDPVYADLAEMPHLLVAGTTGSGKSVGINTMILSLLYRFTPEQCRFILVDPKKVEFALYEGIPHLLTPVITEAPKALMALKWAVHEMEDRYRSMEYLKVKHITTYNEKLKQAQKDGTILKRRVQTGFDPATGEPIFEEQPLDLTPWPYIVFIVDELADLTGQCGKEANPLIQRIAQKARAVGIHLILATQRPSVDVVSGTIKSNFPTRISFMVRNKIDSRTILDEQGAEQLLGKGDMLYTPSGKKAVRVHGPFVSEKDVIAVAKHWSNQGEPNYVDAVVSESAQMAGNVRDSTTGGGNTLYDQAVAIVLRDKKPTTSYIQRRLSIGYNKAADLIEQMEANGVISAPNVAGKREILTGGGE